MLLIYILVENIRMLLEEQIIMEYVGISLKIRNS